MRKPRLNSKANWVGSELGETCVCLCVCRCVCVCVLVCNRKVMSDGKDWLLPPSVPTFNVWRGGRKKERKKERENPHGLRFIFCLLVFFLIIQNLPNQELGKVIYI